MNNAVDGCKEKFLSSPQRLLIVFGSQFPSIAWAHNPLPLSSIVFVPTHPRAGDFFSFYTCSPFPLDDIKK